MYFLMFSGKVLCCPFNMHAVVYELMNGFLIKSASRCFPAGLSSVTVTGLKPENDYEVKMSAINGKGEGDSSQSVVFKTEHVREYHVSLSGAHGSINSSAAWCDGPHTSSPASVKSLADANAKIYSLCSWC